MSESSACSYNVDVCVYGGIAVRMIQNSEGKVVRRGFVYLSDVL